MSASTTPDGANTTYSYGVVLPSDSLLRPGDFFTVYDFAGYVPGTQEAPPNFVFSTAKTGPTPAGVAPPTTRPSTT